MTEKTVSAEGECIPLPLFSIPVVVTNIGRDFTETELQLLLSDILIWKDEGGMSNHQSKDRERK